MHESEQVGDAPRVSHEPLEPLDEDPAPAAPQVREGLPPGFRMRADAHYVDQLDTRMSSIPVRLIDTQAIEATAWDDLRGLLPDEDRERLKVTLAVEWGLPVVEILRYASTHRIGLIAMGTHGHRHLKEMWLGSVASSVVRSAPCTVLVVRPLPNGD